MNQIQLNKQRKENWRKYHIPGQPACRPLKINSFQAAANNSDEHEHAKLAVCLQIKRLGHQFITEAAKNRRETIGLERRVDVVDLDTGLEYEIETDSARAARFKGSGAVVVLVERMNMDEILEHSKNSVI